MNPIQHLLNEHKVIMAEVAQLRQAVADLERRGQAALPEALPVLNRIGQMMETQLALHAKKEDEVLFPAIEAVIGAENGPTGVMRMEHKEIHGQGELLRQTLHELNEVEHPQIVAGGEQLRQLSANGGNAAAFLATASEIIRLLDMHFGKEEQILFPMAASMLDDETLASLGRQMETLK